MSEKILALVVIMTCRWVRLYTKGLSPEIRDRRSAEITSDLWEQKQSDRLEGRRPARTALAIMRRCLLGMPADLAWRWGHMGLERDMPRRLSLRNTVLLITVMALIIVGLAFRSGMPSNGAATPEALVERTHPNAEILMTRPGPPDLVGCIKYCWFADAHPSAIVLYRELDRQVGSAGAYSWELAGESDGTWHSIAGGGADGYAPSLERPLVSFISMKVPQSSITFRYGVRDRYAMTIGQAYSPEVVQVEVRYDSGRIVREQLTNGAFAFFADADAACELGLFDASGQLLQRIGPAEDPLLAMQIERDSQVGCSAAGSADDQARSATGS